MGSYVYHFVFHPLGVIVPHDFHMLLKVPWMEVHLQRGRDIYLTDILSLKTLFEPKFEGNLVLALSTLKPRENIWLLLRGSPRHFIPPQVRRLYFNAEPLGEKNLF